MIPVLAYCGKDCEAALRFVNWCGFMSRENSHNLKHWPILLMISQSVSDRRRHREIVQSAVETFGKVYVHINPIDDERGWPSSPNTMFHAALTHVEEFFKEDMLWLEPDGIPLCEDWLDIIKAEWHTAKESGKSFCGSFVTHYRNHLTGISVYGSNWRAVAPSLATIVESGRGIPEAWDTHAAEEIMPNAYFTKRIQHIFYAPVISGLEILDSEAVIFHQDKQSKLIAFLDDELYGGKAGRDKRWSYLGIEPTISDMKFFHSDNSNRPVRSHGKVFTFEPYEIFAGVWRGTIASQDESDIVALMALAQNQGSGVKEIDQETFERKAKKKVIVSPSSEVSKPAFLARINSSPAEVVVVENPSPSLENNVTGPVPENIDDVIRVSEVKSQAPFQEVPDYKKPCNSTRRKKMRQEAME